MSLEFKYYKIDDIGEVVSGGTPSTSKNEYWYGDIGWITPKDLSSYDDIYISQGERNISREGLNNSSAKLVPKNTVLMTSRAPIGYIAIANKELSTNQGFKSLICDEKICHYKYFYYWLKSNIRYIINNSNGSTFKEISGSTFKNLEISLPSINEQKAISSVLWTIDKKISVLKRINKNLEQLMKCIFDDWFVNFNYSEKVIFKSSELGEIPSNWDVKKLGDVLITLESGKRPKGGISDIDDGIPSIGAENILGLGKFDYSKNKLISHDFFNQMKKGIIQDKDVLLYKDGAQLGRKSLFMNGFPFDVCCINEHVFRLQSNGEVSQFYLYLWLDQPIMTNEIINLNSNSAQPGINQTDVKSLPILVPDIEIMDKFENIISPMMNQIFDNALEINKLSQLRDTLLPKLMSGEIDVSKINCDIQQKDFNNLSSPLQNKLIEVNYMKTKIISKIQNQMKPYLNQGQYIKLTNSLLNSLQDIDIIDHNNELSDVDNFKLLNLFLSAKQVEGCSDKTIIYYKSTIEKMLMKIKKHVYNINTDDLRTYLFNHKNDKHSSKTTIDNIRRIFSSFFSWLEDEDYILKNPVRRIHRVKTGRVVKEVLTDENLEVLRDNCKEIRDLAIVELLSSTGIRVGELVRLNIEDIDFYERECVVFGKGESERVVYFDARTKIHLIEYLQTRRDENSALFVSLNSPYERLGISGVETRLRELGKKCNINKVHPHKFRRTMATNAIDKGMPIEQVQKLLGHVQIDTTMQYAMVNQSNVKLAHRKFIG